MICQVDRITVSGLSLQACGPLHSHVLLSGRDLGGDEVRRL